MASSVFTHAPGILVRIYVFKLIASHKHLLPGSFQLHPLGTNLYLLFRRRDSSTGNAEKRHHEYDNSYDRKYGFLWHNYSFLQLLILFFLWNTNLHGNNDDCTILCANRERKMPLRRKIGDDIFG